MPELSDVPEDMAYDHVIGSVHLLHRCFITFRAQRSHFGDVLVDASGRAVTDDVTPLACGRSLEQVVAMIVCTAARRYFRRQLGIAPPPQPSDNRRRDGLLGRMRLLTAATAERQPGTTVRSPADELYDCIKHHLLYDWQVPLVPTYARMTPTQVQTLGRHLLDYDCPRKLAKALGLPPGLAVEADPDRPLPESAPQPLPSAISGGAALGAEDDGTAGARFADALLSAEVRRALESGNVGFHPASVLETVADGPRSALAGGLGLRLDQLAVVLLAAYGSMGSGAFGRVFGDEANPDMIKKLIGHARQGGIGPETPLPDVAAFIARVFSRVRTAPPG